MWELHFREQQKLGEMLEHVFMLDTAHGSIGAPEGGKTEMKANTLLLLLEAAAGREPTSA